jgi:hypothetical protein
MPPRRPARPTPSWGERYRRLVKRHGKLKAPVAIARTMLVIIWHLLADRAARYHDLGASYYTSRLDTGPPRPQPHLPAPSRRYAVTLTPPPEPCSQGGRQCSRPPFQLRLFSGQLHPNPQVRAIIRGLYDHV